ncbi:MAG TPA: CBS domain-containing protein [Dehalococcoidia bacterium]|nr:CBS domain-containing protein [Dehalococcoidia bacterium]
MNNAFTLGRLFGIQVRLHFTWFIIFVLVTASLVDPDWLRLSSWVVGIATSLLFFASVLAHELAHSLVGRQYGVTIKSITLFVFGGMAHMAGEAKSSGAEFKMALAGPVCSLAIGAFFGLVWFLTVGVLPLVAAMTGWLALINVALAVFNMIPGFPLDGGRVFRAIVWRTTGNYGRSTRIATMVGRVIAYIFIFGGLSIALISFFSRIFNLSFFEGMLFNGIWIAFIGWFLENAASASYRQEQWREAMQRFTVAEVMTTDYLVVPPDMTVAQLVQQYIVPSGRRFFILADEGRLHGMVTLPNIKSLPQQKWATTPVRDIMTPADKLRAVSPNQDAWTVMTQMDEASINQMPVVSENRVIGLVSRDNLIRFLRTRSGLRG